ncbi:unnamed protein product, partial [Mesorhabditis spiculigera]
MSELLWAMICNPGQLIDDLSRKSWKLENIFYQVATDAAGYKRAALEHPVFYGKEIPFSQEGFDVKPEDFMREVYEELRGAMSAKLLIALIPSNGSEYVDAVGEIVTSWGEIFESQGMEQYAQSVDRLVQQLRTQDAMRGGVVGITCRSLRALMPRIVPDEVVARVADMVIAARKMAMDDWSGPTYWQPADYEEVETAVEIDSESDDDCEEFEEVNRREMLRNVSAKLKGLLDDTLAQWEFEQKTLNSDVIIEQVMLSIKDDREIGPIDWYRLQKGLRAEIANVQQEKLNVDKQTKDSGDVMDQVKPAEEEKERKPEVETAVEFDSDSDDDSEEQEVADRREMLHNVFAKLKDRLYVALAQWEFEGKAMNSNRIIEEVMLIVKDDGEIDAIDRYIFKSRLRTEIAAVERERQRVAEEFEYEITEPIKVGGVESTELPCNITDEVIADVNNVQAEPAVVKELEAIELPIDIGEQLVLMADKEVEVVKQLMLNSENPIEEPEVTEKVNFVPIKPRGLFDQLQEEMKREVLNLLPKFQPREEEQQAPKRPGLLEMVREEMRKAFWGEGDELVDDQEEEEEDEEDLSYDEEDEEEQEDEEEGEFGDDEDDVEMPAELDGDEEEEEEEEDSSESEDSELDVTQDSFEAALQVELAILDSTDIDLISSASEKEVEPQGEVEPDFVMVNPEAEHEVRVPFSVQEAEAALQEYVRQLKEQNSLLEARYNQEEPELEISESSADSDLEADFADIERQMVEIELEQQKLDELEAKLQRCFTIPDWTDDSFESEEFEVKSTITAIEGTFDEEDDIPELVDADWTPEVADVGEEGWRERISEAIRVAMRYKLAMAARPQIPGIPLAIPAEAIVDFEHYAVDLEARLFMEADNESDYLARIGGKAYFLAEGIDTEADRIRELYNLPDPVFWRKAKAAQELEDARLSYGYESSEVSTSDDSDSDDSDSDDSYSDDSDSDDSEASSCGEHDKDQEVEAQQAQTAQGLEGFDPDWAHTFFCAMMFLFIFGSLLFIEWTRQRGTAY